MPSETVQLRLIVTGRNFIAQFRPDAEGKFQTAATGKLPAPGDDQVSIQCYNGPANADPSMAGFDRNPALLGWIRFDDFRISDLSDKSELPSKK